MHFDGQTGDWARSEKKKGGKIRVSKMNLIKKQKWNTYSYLSGEERELTLFLAQDIIYSVSKIKI